jgi:ABC-type uncharacterized transport system ATPase component
VLAPALMRDDDDMSAAIMVGSTFKKERVELKNTNLNINTERFKTMMSNNAGQMTNLLNSTLVLERPREEINFGSIEILKCIICQH